MLVGVEVTHVDAPIIGIIPSQPEITSGSRNYLALQLSSPISVRQCSAAASTVVLLKESGLFAVQNKLLRLFRKLLCDLECVGVKYFDGAACSLMQKLTTLKT